MHSTSYTMHSRADLLPVAVCAAVSTTSSATAVTAAFSSASASAVSAGRPPVFTIAELDDVRHPVQHDEFSVSVSASTSVNVASESDVSAHKFNGFKVLYAELLKSKSVVCASPKIRCMIYKALDAAGINHRTVFVENNTNFEHGLGYPHTNRHFSYTQIAKLIRGGRLTLEGLKSAINAFEHDASDYKKYRSHKTNSFLVSAFEEFEFDEKYSLADFSPAFQLNMTEADIARELKHADPYPDGVFYPMWYARLVKATKRIELV